MKILFILIFILLNTKNIFAQLQGQARIDSLIAELPNAKQDTNHVNLLSELSFELYSSNPDKGIEYGLQGVKLSKIIDWKEGEAHCYNSLGVDYSFGKSNYPKALEYYHKALKIYEEIGDELGIANNLLNIGIIYYSQSNYPKALEYYHKALKIYEEFDYEKSAAGAIHNIGMIYANQSDYPKALEYFEKAKKINEKPGGNKIWLANNLINIGFIFKNQSDYPKALEYYHKSLKISEEFGNKLGIAYNLGNMGGLYFELSQDSVLTKISEGTELVSLKNEINLNKSIYYSLQAIELFEEIGELENRSNNLKNLADAYKQKGDYKKEAQYLREHMILKDSVHNQENNDKISALEKLREDVLNRLQIEKQEILLKAKEDEKQLILISAGGALIAVLIILTLIINQRRKSEKLLLNILPASIAKRLKAKEENIADYFKTATTIFIDLVGFTSFAKDKEASEVVELLNNIFYRFDSLANKHGLEKIKTMGDGYLAVSGVPEPDTNHCQKAINFALDIYNELEKFNKEMGLEINARIGLETGPLVAGVIGSSKFIYDIWGDSVNTASRMESTGTPGKIQITENVKTELDKHETNFQFEKREPFEVKGKGLMQTYYLE